MIEKHWGTGIMENDYVLTHIQEMVKLCNNPNLSKEVIEDNWGELWSYVYQNKEELSNKTDYAKHALAYVCVLKGVKLSEDAINHFILSCVKDKWSDMSESEDKDVVERVKKVENFMNTLNYYNQEPCKVDENGYFIIPKL